MKLRLASLGFLLSLMGSATTLAEVWNGDDWKGYAGLNCLPPNAQLDIRRSSSGLSNWDDRTVTVYCPVVRDHATGSREGIRAARVRLFNNNGQQGGSCTLISRGREGEIIDSEVQTWPAGYEYHDVNFGALDTSNWGYIQIYCRLPAAEGARKSFIQSYAVHEE